MSDRIMVSDLSRPPEPLDAPTAAEARAAIDALLRDLDALTVVVGIAARAWSRLDFDDRREIGRRWPALANALIAAEQRDGAP